MLQAIMGAIGTNADCGVVGLKVRQVSFYTYLAHSNSNTKMEFGFANQFINN